MDLGREKLKRQDPSGDSQGNPAKWISSHAIFRDVRFRQRARETYKLCPPLTSMHCPVTQRASSEATKPTTSAMSAG